MLGEFNFNTQQSGSNFFQKIGNGLNVNVENKSSNSQVQKVAANAIKPGIDRVDVSTPKVSYGRLNSLARSLENKAMELSYEQLKSAQNELAQIKAGVPATNLDAPSTETITSLVMDAEKQLADVEQYFASNSVPGGQARTEFETAQAALNTEISNEIAKAEGVRDSLIATIGELDDLIDAQRGVQVGTGGSGGNRSEKDLTRLRDQASDILEDIEKDLEKGDKLEDFDEYAKDLEKLSMNASKLAQEEGSATFANELGATIDGALTEAIDGAHSVDSIKHELELSKRMDKAEAAFEQGDFEKASKEMSEVVKRLGKMNPDRIDSSINTSMKASLERSIAAVDAGNTESVVEIGSLEVAEKAFGAAESLRSAASALKDGKPLPAAAIPEPEVQKETADLKMHRAFQRARSRARMSHVKETGMSSIASRLQAMDETVSTKDLKGFNIGSLDQTGAFDKLKSSVEKTSILVNEKMVNKDSLEEARAEGFQELAEKIASKADMLADSVKDGRGTAEKIDLIQGYSMDDMEKISADETKVAERTAAESAAIVTDRAERLSQMTDQVSEAHNRAAIAQEGALAAQEAADVALVQVQEASSQEELDSALEASQLALQAASTAKSAAQEAVQLASETKNELVRLNDEMESAMKILNKESDYGYLSEETAAAIDEVRASFDAATESFDALKEEAKDTVDFAKDVRDLAEDEFQEVADLHAEANSYTGAVVGTGFVVTSSNSSGPGLAGLPPGQGGVPPGQAKKGLIPPV